MPSGPGQETPDPCLHVLRKPLGSGVFEERGERKDRSRFTVVTEQDPQVARKCGQLGNQEFPVSFGSRALQERHRVRPAAEGALVPGWVASSPRSIPPPASGTGGERPPRVGPGRARRTSSAAFVPSSARPESRARHPMAARCFRDPFRTSLSQVLPFRPGRTVAWAGRRRLAPG